MDEFLEVNQFIEDRHQQVRVKFLSVEECHFRVVCDFHAPDRPNDTICVHVERLVLVRVKKQLARLCSPLVRQVEFELLMIHRITILKE